jgi:hypothetical protein
MAARFVKTPQLRRPLPGEHDYLKRYPWLQVTQLEYYSDIIGELIVVPAGFRTDFASVPWIFRRLFPQDGPWTLAAIVHDWLCELRLYDHRTAALIFREAMLVAGVQSWQAGLMYRAVLWFGPRW